VYADPLNGILPANSAKLNPVKIAMIPDNTNAKLTEPPV